MEVRVSVAMVFSCDMYARDINVQEGTIDFGERGDDNNIKDSILGNEAFR
jgi:hypothetical protein